MATKPPDNLPEWADGSNGGNYTGGPFAGSPRKVSIPNGIAAEGYRPGKNDPSTAEHLNDYTNKLSKFIRWVYAGSSTGAADAHILECNDDGGTSVQSIYILGAADPGQDALRIDGPTDSYGAWVRGHVDSTTAAVRVTHAGDAIGLDVTSNSSSQPALSAGVTQLTGDTVRPALTANSAADLSAAIIGNSTATNGGGVLGAGTGSEPGVNGFAGGSGPGVKGNSTTGPGVLGLANSTSSGVKATSTTAIAAIDASNTSTGDGIHGSGVIAVKGTSTSTAGAGVRGETPAAATSAAAGVIGVATASGVGVVGTTVNGKGGSFAASGTGDGVVATTVSGNAGDFSCSGNGNAARFDAAGTKPTTVHVPRAADPSSNEDGGMWYRDNVGMKVRREGVTRTLCDSAGGSAFAAAGPSAGFVTDTPTVILSAALSGANAPVASGTVMIRVSLEIGRASGTPDAKIEISKNGGSIIVGSAETITMFHGTGIYERFLSFEVPYAVTAGAITIDVTLYSTVAGQNVNYRNAGISVSGVY